jgi:uncharacterized protein YjbI with pentapeptide repeats/endonuclease YncB( thermonuclease family)
VTPRLLRFLGAAAVAAVVVITVWLAKMSGASDWFAGLYGVVVALGAYLALRTQTPQEKVSDAGRGVVVAILLALVANSISHREAVRNARNSLRLTLSSGNTFTGIDLRRRDLRDAYIGGKHLSDADLSGADLANAVLAHSTLRNADFHGRDTDLSNADLSFADLSGADLRSVRLNGADLTEANLRDARLAGTDLHEAKLDGAHLDGADLRQANLRSALLVGTHMPDALLIDADLRGANLNDDLREAELDGAALNGVRTDSSTIWPDGFDLGRAVSEAAAGPAEKIEVPSNAVEDVVSKVADGDTIQLRALGPVRLLGIDAPSEERPPDCYGHKATKAVRRLLAPGTRVRYVLGNTLEDAFHRNLAYLWLKNGDFVEERIVSSGWAIFLRPPRGKELPDVEQGYARRLMRDEIRAAMKNRGLWGACPAAGD